MVIIASRSLLRQKDEEQRERRTEGASVVSKGILSPRLQSFSRTRSLAVSTCLSLFVRSCCCVVVRN